MMVRNKNKDAKRAKKISVETIWKRKFESMRISMRVIKGKPYSIKKIRY